MVSEIFKKDKSGVEMTSWWTAYLRTFSDIPYCQEIFKEIEKIRMQAGEGDVPENLKKPGLAPQLEARYKLITKMLLGSGIKQVLELASGYTPRGLNLTIDGSIEQYVELELPLVAREKNEILKKVASPLPSNLHIEAGDVLKFEDISRAIKYIKEDQPLAVVNEGLMRYLNFDQKRKLAENIKVLLQKFGGAWITSDISLKKIIQGEDKVTSNNSQNLARLSNIDFEKNLFDSEEHAQRFFSELGYDIFRHSFVEIEKDLISPKKLGLSRDEVAATNNNAVVYVMKLAAGNR